MRTINKDSLVAMGLVAAVLAATVLLVYLPQSRKLDSSRTELATIRQRLETDSRRASIVPTLLQEIDTLRGQYRDFDHKLPKDRELGGFLGEISNHLGNKSLLDSEIVPGNPSSEDLYNTLPIMMTCRGSYLSLADFLQEISRMRRLTRVHTLKIDAGERDELLDVRMQLNIYFTQS